MLETKVPYSSDALVRAHETYLHENYQYMLNENAESPYSRCSYQVSLLAKEELTIVVGRIISKAAFLS